MNTRQDMLHIVNDLSEDNLKYMMHYRNGTNVYYYENILIYINDINVHNLQFMTNHKNGGGVLVYVQVYNIVSVKNVMFIYMKIKCAFTETVYSTQHVL